MDDIRRGDYSGLLTDEDEEEVHAEEEALEVLRAAPTAASPTQPAAPVLPPVLQRIFGTSAEEELMAVAKVLDPNNKRPLTLLFHTDVGDVRCPVNWSSTDPEHLDKTQHLLLVLVRSKDRDTFFAPHPGSEMEISFIYGQNGRRSRRLMVTSLAAPMQLYPGAGIDLLCFLPHTDDVEKNGRVSDCAPSVVSGRPSDGVDHVTGEPVAAGEKSAHLRLPPHLLEQDRKLAAVEDFDKVRES